MSTDAREAKRREIYEAILAQGASKEKAARIANAQMAGTVDHDSRAYEDRTVKELRAQAREVGIAGRSTMTKAQLIEALRNG